jgi:hypothetical protein
VISLRGLSCPRWRRGFRYILERGVGSPFGRVAFEIADRFSKLLMLGLQGVTFGCYVMSRFGDAPPPFYYIAYIDEAGDPGIDSVQPNNPRGASEWLSVGATLIRASYEQEQVQWVKDINASIRSRQGAILHFRRLSDCRKETACQNIAGLKLRSFAVVSNKVNMEGHRNVLAEAYPGPRGWFYNWCIRVILERITDCVERSAVRNNHEPRHVKLVFSERGGVKYRWLSAYIETLMQQAQDGTTVLPKRVVKWQVMHPKLIEIVRHDQSAGAQLADCVASAFFSAAHSRGPRWHMSPAELLKPCIATDHGTYCEYGVTLQPWMWSDRKKLLSDQKKIFQFYGYDFW